MDDVVAGIVEGIANGCGENGCVLLGGETAEMPDFYSAGEYDVPFSELAESPDSAAGSPDDGMAGMPSIAGRGWFIGRRH